MEVVKVAKSNFTIRDVRERLRKRIKNFDRYCFEISLSGGIINIEASIYGEASADIGGKEIDQILDELALRVLKIIERYNRKN